MLGSVLDVNLPSQVAEYEGERWNQLALAALGMQPVLQKPSLVTIQTLHIASIYHVMLGNEASGGESSMEFTWSLVNLAAHLAQTVRYVFPRICRAYAVHPLIDWTKLVVHICALRAVGERMHGSCGPTP